MRRVLIAAFSVLVATSVLVAAATSAVSATSATSNVHVTWTETGWRFKDKPPRGMHPEFGYFMALRNWDLGEVTVSKGDWELYTGVLTNNRAQLGKVAGAAIGRAVWRFDYQNKTMVVAKVTTKLPAGTIYAQTRAHDWKLVNRAVYKVKRGTGAYRGVTGSVTVMPMGHTMKGKLNAIFIYNLKLPTPEL